MGREYRRLHDPNAEYTVSNLSAETMGVTRSRGGDRDIEIADVQTTMVDGEELFDER
ncbi:L-alanine-DL-glutamate epimerase or related enzyme of enolase superfamily [Halapricum desulfuricans]|uniref:L-alanine-DL-glutamate epimerase or related enzyme of enolase superfamily n=1 Tax=Halapricum desulfuricans TaxID=2841257 RepID=A0A897NXG8_9EURY|nr:L-alanine-DL-glutamate epimerase or related enzyme of enolase superfamily [Halapricum desulfuricans]